MPLPEPYRGKEAMKFPTYQEFAQKCVDLALDEILYKDKTLREWIEIIINNDGIPICDYCKHTFEPYEGNTGEFTDCSTCKNNDLPWDEEPCDSCCKGHSGYERVDEPIEEYTSRRAILDALCGHNYEDCVLTVPCCQFLDEKVFGKRKD